MPRTFRILRTLGRGAFGEVHLAEMTDEEDFRQTLAVKWLHADLSADPQLAGRLRDEARLLALLQHPNIVRVQGLTRIDGRLAVLMEAVRGRDLSDLPTGVPPRAAAQIIGAAADALDAAFHACPPEQDEPLRVVHRDLKPSNLMVTPRGHLKVMDFGVARATFESREAQTASHQFGTARYMAPERWLEGDAGPASDIYSLGITLIELVSGEPIARPRLSRQGFSEDRQAALERLAPWPELADLADRMTRFAPEERPAARDVADEARGLMLPGDDLETWAVSLPPTHGTTDDRTGTLVVEDTTGGPVAATGPVPDRTPATSTAPTAPVASTRSGPPWIWALAGVALLAVVFIGGWSTGAGEQATPRPQTAPVPARAPAPGPPPAPPPVPEPAPAQATPPVPAPATQPAAAPATRPDPAPQVTAIPPAPAARVPVTFVVQPPTLKVRTPSGPVTHRQAMLLPAGQLLQLEVQDETGTWPCVIPVETAPATWRVDGAGRRCVKDR